jgi:hypothetical protein
MLYSPMEMYYSTNLSIPLDYTVTDNWNISSCWFFILNSTGGYEKSNTTLTNCQNTTFNVSKDDTYTLYLYVNDSANNINFSSVIFGVSTINPAVSLNSPSNNKWFNSLENNIYFNFTATNSFGIDTCELWGNWSGGWHKNYTWTAPTNATMNYTVLNLSEGRYRWNVWCNNTIGNAAWALFNWTVGVDITPPNVNITSITVSPNSQTIRFTANATDNLGIASCKYSIFNRLGTIDGLNNNITFPCSSQVMAVVSGYDNFNLTVYTSDNAGNEVGDTKSFTTYLQGGSTGGGGAIIITPNNIYQTLIPAGNFSLTSLTRDSIIDYVLAKDSKRARTKEILIVNKGLIPLNITLLCDDGSLTLNETENVSDLTPKICDYVEFGQAEYIVQPNENLPTRVQVRIKTPENTSFGQVYKFNIIAVKEETPTQVQYAKLSVVARVPIWGVLYKWDYVPLQDTSLSPKELNSYPVAPIALIAALVVFTLIFALARRKYIFTGFVVGVVSFFSSFIALIFYL